ncbi:MAG: 4-hydroxythreonine-4-phosphate dehydrogenase PdxA [Pseudomonadota bacterium]
MTATQGRRIAVTCGEPAGIGPEIIVKAWQALRGELEIFVIGDPAHFADLTPLQELTDPAIKLSDDALPILTHDFEAPRIPGKPDPANAQGVVDVIARAVNLVRAGQASALCTAPIHKQVLQDGAAFSYPGHTEYLADLAGADTVVMMLASDQLHVVPVTIHMALEQVKTALTPQLLEETIRITHAGLIRDFGIDKPRLAIAGLNPHAGEGGKIGREEIELIAPVLARLSDDGFDLRGPLSADTMFHAAARETYDAAICMYHDQALIPIKTLDFDRGVNVTLGLPFVRTSPDHGTALDIAGQGIANPSSMIEALRLADRMAQARA